MTQVNEEKKELIAMLEKVEDPRKKRGIRFSLASVLYMMIFAACANCECCADVVAYVETNRQYFMSNLKLETLPSQATFYRIFEILDYRQLAKNLSLWLVTNFPAIARKYFGLKVGHFDGKAIRGRTEKSAGGKPQYFINFQLEGETISLCFLPVGEKTNERGELVNAIDMFDISKTLITIDAAGTTSAIIRKITDKGGFFLLPVKEGNENLRSAIMARVDELKRHGEWENLDSFSSCSKEHGRIEEVTMVMISDTSFIPKGCGFSGNDVDIARIGVMTKKVTEKRNGQWVTMTNTTYLITNLVDTTAEALAKYKETHWNIEAQHYILDVRLREDFSTARKGFAAHNMSVLRRFSLAIRERVPEIKKMKTRQMKFEFARAERVEEVLFANAVKEISED